MFTDKDRYLGDCINRLLRKDHLSRNESRDAFCVLVNNESTEMQQGAFLAALTAKGETAHEVAGIWDAIYAMDTCKVDVDRNAPLAENSGTGMDTMKTFNISTAAAIIAAAGGVRMARHGARAITSMCGTVDMAEALGVDVSCGADIVAGSIEKTGLGLFNGMSPETHPRALFRILSNICFGSTLNIAASLANPAMPSHGVRGVYAKSQLAPVADVMQAIGYKRAIVVHGTIDGSDLGMDEASVCGTTYCMEISPDAGITGFTFRPEDFNMTCHRPETLRPDRHVRTEAARFVRLLKAKEDPARLDAIVLNAGLLFYITGKSASISDGIAVARAILFGPSAYALLEKWVMTQNRHPDQGLATLRSLN